MQPVTHEIFALNNSNGASIKTVDYNSSTGIVTCTLVTPILGFSTSPFSVGEKIFVEGIQQYTHNKITPVMDLILMIMDLNSLKFLQWLTIIQQLLNLIYLIFTSNAGVAKQIKIHLHKS